MGFFMLIILLNRMSNFFDKIPNVFFYSSTRMMLSALTSLVITLALGPSIINRLYNLKTGQSIRVEDCPLLAKLHQVKKNTPTMGGILMLFSILVSSLLWMDLSHIYTVILLIGTVWMGLIGAFDDYLKMKKKNSKGISGKKKFVLQLVFASIVGFYLYIPSAQQFLDRHTCFKTPTAKHNVIKNDKNAGMQSLSLTEAQSQYYMPFKKNPFFTLSRLGIFFGFLMTIFVITGSSNAVNLSDGLDGLSSGLILMTSTVLAIVAFLMNHLEFSRYLNILYIEGSAEIGIFLAAIAGSTLGFLWFNNYPAQIFMGDTGSLPLGGLLGTCAVLLRRELLLALIGGVFVAETLSVIIQVASYKLRRKRVFLCSPLHHHFEYKGWPETKIVLRFWIIGFFLAILGLASLKFQ